MGPFVTWKDLGDLDLYMILLVFLMNMMNYDMMHVMENDGQFCKYDCYVDKSDLSPLKLSEMLAPPCFVGISWGPEFSGINSDWWSQKLILKKSMCVLCENSHHVGLSISNVIYTYVWYNLIYTSSFIWKPWHVVIICEHYNLPVVRSSKIT